MKHNKTNSKLKDSNNKHYMTKYNLLYTKRYNILNTSFPNKNPYNNFSLDGLNIYLSNHYNQSSKHVNKEYKLTNTYTIFLSNTNNGRRWIN
jgi:hypothetical protein